MAPIIVDFAISTAARVLVKQGIKYAGKYVVKKIANKLANKVGKEAAKNLSKKVKRGGKKNYIDGTNQAGQTVSKLYGNIQKNDNLDFHIESFSRTYDQNKKLSTNRKLESKKFWSKRNMELEKFWSSWILE